MTNFTTKIKFPKIEIKNIISESTPKKYDRRKLLSESEKGCKQEWYWYYEDPNSQETKEYNTDKGGPTKGKYSPNLPKGCWNGKDPLSCNLRKSIGQTYGLKAAPCSSASQLYGIYPYCDLSTNCLLGSLSAGKPNPFIKNDTLKRVEFFIVAPNSPNNSDVLVQVFRERKDVISSLEPILGKKKLTGTENLSVYGGLLGGSYEGCYFWKKTNLTDSEVVSVINILNGKTDIAFISNSSDNISSGSNNNKETPVKTPEEIKKELLARPDTNIVAPRLYVESLGFTDWKQYQKDFGCPTSKENKSEHIKCNQNIATAFKDGWRPGNEIPEDKRGSKYVGLGSGKGEGDGEGDSKNSEKTDGIFGGKWGGTTPEITDIPGLEPAQFDGNLEKWFADSFVYPKEAEEKGLEGFVEVNFTINEKGEVESVDSDSDVEDILKKDAIELIKKMPKWVPSKKDGVAIPTSTSIEVKYFLGFE
jgi:TonB family protein